MTRWKDEPWAKVPVLIAELETMYGKAVAAGRISNPTDTAVRKIIQHREWCDVLRPDVVAQVVDDLDVVYVPKGIGPGPGICFPIRDLSGRVERLHIRLLEDQPEFYKMKYMSLMDTERFIGPPWVGTDEATMQAIVDTGDVFMVEGPLDLLAIRVMGCTLPTLCPTSKKLTEDHWDYLRVLGVQRIVTMFDHEISGVGTKAANALSRNRYGIESITIRCPAKDPADACRRPQSARALRALMRNLAQNLDSYL